MANTLPFAGMPSDNAQYAKFVRLVATRYKGKVANYEVWNEPNAIFFWQPAPNATQYTALLKAAYTAIKGADPNAMVIAAGVGAVVDFGSLTVNPVRFITEMYQAGAAGYFDALAFHPYLSNNPFSQGTPYPDSPLNQVKQIYNLMVANGDGNKKIWATEYGQPSSVVSEANEASYLGDFLRTWRNLPFAGTCVHPHVVRHDGFRPRGGLLRAVPRGLDAQAGAGDRQAGHRGEPGDRGGRERPRDVGRAELADVLAQERDVVLAALVGGLADDRRVGRFDHRHQQLRVDLAGAEVGVPVGAGARGVA